MARRHDAAQVVAAALSHCRYHTGRQPPSVALRNRAMNSLTRAIRRYARRSA